MNTVKLTAEQLQRITQSTRANASLYIEHLNAAMLKYNINSPLRVAHFIAQLTVESMSLSQTVENMNYSAARLKVIWPSRFNDSNAHLFAYKPEALANNVYAGRLGNQAQGDGWRYRGQGLIQLTGKLAYIAYMFHIDDDVLVKPDLLQKPRLACDSAAWFFSKYKPAALRAADADDVLACTRAVNGGTHGLAERKAALTRAKKELDLL